MGESNNCEHKGCNCPVVDEGGFCSDQCRDAASSEGIECDCGHSSCG